MGAPVVTQQIIDPASVPDASPEEKSNTVGPWRYALYGCRVRSDIRLPSPTLEEDDEPIDLEFNYAKATNWLDVTDGTRVSETRCHAPCHRGAVARWVARSEEGIWLWADGVGTFHIAADSRSVAIRPQDGSDEQEISLVLIGQVVPLIMHRIGRPCLHASAVIIDALGGAVAFIGAPGYGKSTMIAAFLRRGATMLTDDVLPLRAHVDGIDGVPSLPLMKIWRATAEGTLALTDELPHVTAGYDKRLFVLDERYPFAHEQARVRAVYLLDRYDPAIEGQVECSAHTLSPREGLITLLAHIPSTKHLPPSDTATILRSCTQLLRQAPLRVLRYPHGFEYQDAVCQWLLTDVKERQ